MTDLLVGIGVAIFMFIAGGTWRRKKQMDAARKEKKETEARLKKGREDAEAAFTDKPDAARDWLRKR